MNTKQVDFAAFLAESIEAICGKEPAQASVTRITELCLAATIRGHGINLPSKRKVPYYKVHAFVSSCYATSEKSFDGPLDIMDRRVDNFVETMLKNATNPKTEAYADAEQHRKDSVFLENICYDMATLDL